MVGFRHDDSGRCRAYCLLFFICCLILAPGVRADAESHRINVEQLISLMDLEAQSNKALQAIPSAFNTQMQRAEMPVEYAEVFNEYQEKMAALMEASIGWPVLRPIYVSYYAELFSEQELQEILTFLGSTTGRNFLESLRNVTTQMDAYIQVRVANIRPELDVLSADFRLQILTIQQSLVPAAPAVSGSER